MASGETFFVNQLKEICENADKFCEEFEKIWKANGGEQMISEAKEQKKVNDSIIAQLP